METNVVPIVTQNRDLSGPVHWTGYLNGVHVSEDDYPFGGFQTTTSYRSFGGRANGKFLDYSRLSGPELQAGLANEYRTTYDTGNEFYTRKVQVVRGNGNSVYIYKQPEDAAEPLEWYSGFLQVGHPEWSWTDFGVGDVSSSDIKVNGAKCIANTIPTKAEASLAQFLIELKDGIPYLFGTVELKRGVSNSYSESAQSAYLNSEFGVKPFLGDLQRMGLAIKHASKLVDAFVGNSGKNVRRATTLYDVSEDGSSDSFRHYPLLAGTLPTRFIADYGITGWHDYIRRVCRFSGAYSYYVDKGHDFLTKLVYYERLADYLLGTDFNVSTAWEVLPWSWLSQWFYDTSTFISNVQALSDDSLVLRYGYVMHTTSVVRNITQENIVPKADWHGVPPILTQQVEMTIKQRNRATPYGFGANPSSFTARQWAILAALGMTRGDSNLRRQVS